MCFVLAMSDGVSLEPNPRPSCDGAQADEICYQTMSLVQSRIALARKKAATQPNCVSLKNEGSYFTIPLCVGTPPQCFDVVADTGSNSVIVPSCICGERAGGCKREDKCYRGTNKSSTFLMGEEMPMMAITFGSGTIQAAVVTDVVDVGGVRATMREGVLLMMDRTQLRISGTFEGIFGLGVPKQTEQVVSLAATKVAQQPLTGGMDPLADVISRMKDIFGDGQVPLDPFRGTPSSHSDSRIPRHGAHSPHSGAPRVELNVTERLFLKEAGVERFSMCFRDMNMSGSLRMGLPQFKKSIAQAGKFHWGLGLYGLSVGAKGSSPTTEFILCGPEAMKPGMQSPCGMIPDSGTTLLLGPKQQVQQLEAAVCDRWDRCKRLQKNQASASLDERQKSLLFKQLLFKCNSWLTESSGLHEIPSLFFHVRGRDNASDVFELTAWAWITETTYINVKQDGDDLVSTGTHAEMGSLLNNGTAKVCTSSVGSMGPDYVTEKNGPIWIAGSPLFYEYVVGYDYSTMSVSLEQGKCEPCDAGVALLSSEEDRRNRGRPRFMDALPRVPQYDITLPL
jgi:hypothetical protein